MFAASCLCRGRKYRVHYYYKVNIETVYETGNEFDVIVKRSYIRVDGEASFVNFSTIRFLTLFSYPKPNDTKRFENFNSIVIAQDPEYFQGWRRITVATVVKNFLENYAEITKSW